VTLRQPSTQSDYNGAAKFDGTSANPGCIVISAGMPTFGTTMSIDFWFIPSATPAAPQCIWSDINKGTGDATWAVFWQPTLGNKVSLFWSGANHTNNTAITVGVAHHVAISINAGVGTFYIDGVADGGFTGWPGGFSPIRIATAGNIYPYKGVLDEMAVYNVALTAQDIANRMAARIWTDLTPDLVDEIQWDRGLQDNKPDQLVAKTGTLSFSLRNDQFNSTKTRKYYSPNAPACRPGFTFGIPVRVMINDSVTDHPRWIGKIHDIEPESGKWGSRRTRCTGVDTINDLAESDIHSIPPQLSKTEVQLLNAVHNELSEDAKPPTLNFDTALDSYPYAFDDVSSGVRALYAINQVLTSSRGLYYQDRKGTHIYVNRQTLQAKDVSFVFSDSHGMVVPASLDNVFNRVRVVQHLRTVNLGTIIVLYAASGRMQLAAGQSVEVFGDYSDPTNRDRLLGGTNFQTPLVASTDYSATQNQDGTGTDYTASVTVGVYPFAASAKFTMKNNHATQSVWVQYQIRGSGIYDNAPISFDAFTPMPYGDRLLTVDLMYQANQSVAQDLARLIQKQTINLANQVETMDLIPAIDATWKSYAVESEISDVLTISDDQTGVQAASAYIYAIRESFDAEGIYKVQYLLYAKGQGVVTFIFDDTVHGLFDSPVSLLGFG